MFDPSLCFSILVQVTPDCSSCFCTALVQNSICTFCGRKSRFALHWCSYILLSNLITHLKDFILSLQMVVLSFDSQYNSHPKREGRSQEIVIFCYLSASRTPLSPSLWIYCLFLSLANLTVTLKVGRSEIKTFKSLDNKSPVCPWAKWCASSNSIPKSLYNHLGHLWLWNSSLMFPVGLFDSISPIEIPSLDSFIS